MRGQSYCAEEEHQVKWNKYRMKTTTQAVDMISYTLGEMGIEGIEIEDRIPLTEEEKREMFIDILPDLGEDDGVAYVSFYIEPEKDHPEMIADVQAAVGALSSFVDVGDLTIEKTQTADVDWMNNWKQYWKPFYVDEKIMIRPTWEKTPDVAPDTLVVQLDPGTSFGTGMHHTTRLCIAQMKKYLKPGQALLDVGCGSGILAIIGWLLGAGETLATDVDPHAVEAALENAKVNGITEDDITILTGDLITDAAFRKSCGEGKYDLVLANILADIIIPLSGVIGQLMKPGALFVSSGIIENKGPAVEAALIENGFEIVEMTQSGDWVSFTARRSDL